MSQRHGRNGLNVLGRVFRRDEEFVRSTTTVMDSNMKNKHAQMLMSFVFSHFLMNYLKVSGHFYVCAMHKN